MTDHMDPVDKLRALREKDEAWIHVVVSVAVLVTVVFALVILPRWLCTINC